MTIRRAVPLLAAVLLAGCSSSDDGESAGSDDSSSTSTASTADSPGTTAPRTAAPSSLTDPATGGDLVGSWTADAKDILEANTINLGDGDPIPCSGPLVMTFGGDGSYDRSGTMTCAADDRLLTFGLSSVGRWESTGSTLIISDTVNSMTMVVEGAEIPVPDVIPVPDTFVEGTGEYSIVGDTLSITFTTDPVGTVVHVYARAA